MLAVSFSDWIIPLAVAAVPAIVSAIAAILSARSARKSRRAEFDAARLRDLEDRLAEHRYAMYRPMLDLFKRIFATVKSGAKVTQKEIVDKTSDFGTWITIFGSDEAVRAFHNYMQATYRSPPAPILMRLYADFVLAARRDLGDSRTAITRAEILGIRINDMYEDPSMWELTTLSFEDLCERWDWQPPWPP